MARWIMLAYSNCTDPAREEEFNDWYDNIHVPDALENPGFLNATRYVSGNPSGDTSKFLATYEIETEDILKTWVAVAENRRKNAEEGRISELVEVVAVAMYRQISSAIR